MANSFERIHILVGVVIVAIVGGFIAWAVWPEPEDPDILQARQVLARVNGDTIERGALVDEALAQDLIPNAESLDLRADSIQALLNDMIDQKLLAGAARSQGLDQSERGKRAIALAEDRALSEIFLRAAVDAEVTEESLRALYDEQIGSGEPGDEVRAKHILVATEEEAQDVYTQLQEGENFEELAKQVSQDPGSAAQGGALGYFTKERMVPEFANVAFATKVGELSEPFQSQFGWHVLKVEDKRKGVLPSFQELRQQILRYQTFTVVQNTINDLRSEAEIDYLMPEAITPDIDFSEIEKLIEDAEKEADLLEDQMNEAADALEDSAPLAVEDVDADVGDGEAVDTATEAPEAVATEGAAEDAIEDVIDETIENISDDDVSETVREEGAVEELPLDEAEDTRDPEENQ